MLQLSFNIIKYSVWKKLREKLYSHWAMQGNIAESMAIKIEACINGFKKQI